MIKRYIRNKMFTAAGHELAAFLEDHEEDPLREFRTQLQKMDDEIPEEESFIDIKMVPLGETILKASLIAIREFLKGEPGPSNRKKSPRRR